MTSQRKYAIHYIFTSFAILEAALSATPVSILRLSAFKMYNVFNSLYLLSDWDPSIDSFLMNHADVELYQALKTDIHFCYTMFTITCKHTYL